MVHKKETIDARLLRIFVEVAKRRSVTAAAETLEQPKSGVSKAISALEARLGVRLLERSTRRVTVTHAGEVLQSRAGSILAELDGLVDDLHGEVDAIRGVVRIAAPPELGTLLAARFFPELLARHPELSINVLLDYAFADVLDPKFDLGLRIGEVHDERLVARRLGAFSRILVAQPSYVARQPVRSPADLAKCNCLVFSGTERAATWTLRRVPGDARRGAPCSPQDVAVQGNFAVHGFTALLAAAAAGAGIARVPAFLAGDAIAGGRLARVLPEWEAMPSDVYLVHRYGHDRVRRVREVIDAAQEHIAGLLGAPTRGC